MKGRADRRARIQMLCRMGFAPSPADEETLSEQVARLENNSEYRYRIENPMRASLAGRPVWFYTEERARQGNVVAAHEFRFRLDRDSSEGLVLFFKPSGLRPGTTVTLIGSLAPHPTACVCFDRRFTELIVMMPKAEPRVAEIADRSPRPCTSDDVHRLRRPIGTSYCPRGSIRRIFPL